MNAEGFEGFMNTISKYSQALYSVYEGLKAFLYIGYRNINNITKRHTPPHTPLKAFIAFTDSEKPSQSLHKNKKPSEIAKIHKNQERKVFTVICHELLKLSNREG